MRLAAGSVELTGNEFGELPDTPDGLKALRAAARAYLETLRGKWVDCPALGRKVEIRNRSIKEMMAFSGNPLKLRALAALEQIIRTGQEPKREENWKAKKGATVAYYRLRSTVHIGGKPVSVTVVIEEDLQGFLHYDLMLEKTKAALDSSAAASEPVLHHDHDSWNAGEEIVSTEAAFVNNGPAGGVLNLFLAGEDAGVLDGTSDLEPKAAALAAATGLERVSLARQMQALLAREEAFRRWFAGSKIVGADGEPLVMYHGTYKDFAAFDRMASAWRGQSIDMVGSWFSTNPGEGGSGMYASGAGAAIYPVYLKVERPKYFDTFREMLNAMHEAEGRDPEQQRTRGKGSPEGLREVLKSQGYDGIALSQTNVGEQEDDLGEVLASIRRAKDEEFSVPKRERAPYTAKRERLEETAARLRSELEIYGGSTEFDKQIVVIVFEPHQIKSALGNSGAFDPTSPNILDAVASPLARLRLVTTLRAKVEQYAGAGNAIQRLRLVQEIRALLAELGVAGSAKVSPHVTLLREVVAGEHDTESFAASYGMIQEAINALEEAGDLAGEVEALAHQAISHWAEREEEIHG